MTQPSDSTEGADGAASETLSSPLTFLFKYVFTTIWPAVFGLGTLLMFVSKQPQAHQARGLFAVLFVLGSLFLWWGCSGLKRVELHGRILTISNFRREATVPVQEIAQVSQNRMLSMRPITLAFKSSTPFGRSITFIPPPSLRLLSEDSIAARLREMAGESGPA